MQADNAHYTPTFSVIVATYNCQDRILETFQSLIAQSHKDFEVIVIDGGSKDQTLARLAEFQSMIASLISEPDNGIADAWNKGIKLARGRFVGFLNAGDLWHPDHIKRASAALSRNIVRDNLFLFCDVQKFSAQGRLGAFVRGHCPNKTKLAAGVGFPHPGSFVDRSVFDRLGLFSTNLKIAIDTEFILRCIQADCVFQKFDSIAYMAEGGISDLKFRAAMDEYYQLLVAHSLTTRARQRTMPPLLAAGRRLLHVYRWAIRPILRSAKHFLIALVNLLADMMIFNWMKRLYLVMLGFRMGPKVCIGLGTHFYRRGNVTIGTNSVINRGCLIDNRAPVSIGRNVSISRNVSIFTAGHDPYSPFFEMVLRPVTIGDHAVIFSHAVIAPGVIVGEGAVVYPGAVVTKSIPAMAMVGGNPAKVIGQRPLAPRYALDYPYPLAM